ncbi:AAA family ATPase, partial [uncultured Treponema sp.]|uniref:AAA family ATPase n=1 Tax=uncultured Treponema sp. TaxID=162155 RepID=UPI00338E20BC
MSKIYLKKVNLIGYKTFSKFATVELQKNLNIVFGPSGCGKSTFLKSLNRMN